MNKDRMEAFSDGVLAVIITIMVLEMKSPRGPTLAALRPVLPGLLSYLLSFVYIGIYWNNHHHLLHATQHVNGATLWANLHLLFWLSLIPFATAWMDENRFDSWPVAAYGIRSAVGSYRLFHPYQDPHQPSWARLDARNIYWARQKRQNFNCDPRGGNSASICALMDCGRLLYHRSYHVADPRPSYREKSGKISLTSSQSIRRIVGLLPSREFLVEFVALRLDCSLQAIQRLVRSWSLSSARRACTDVVLYTFTEQVTLSRAIGSPVFALLKSPSSNSRKVRQDP
jgi:Endosomal/lysosomal potassium channel TMEM175